MTWTRQTRARRDSDQLALLLLCLLAFAIRLYGLSYQSLWRDEVDSIRFAARAAQFFISNFRSP